MLIICVLCIVFLNFFFVSIFVECFIIIFKYNLLNIIVSIIISKMLLIIYKIFILKSFFYFFFENCNVSEVVLMMLVLLFSFVNLIFVLF